MLSLEDAQALEREAEGNNGHCTHCGQTIKVYKYKANRTIALMLLKIADRVKETGNPIVHYDDISVSHAFHSQRAKLRQHGLIYKHKENGRHIANKWGITTKGWQWIKGEPIPTRVIVFNNQVLGHDGGTITIAQALGEKYDPQIYASVVISEPEARAYADIQKPEYNKEVDAKYLGYTGGELISGQTYPLKMARLQIGKPLQIQMPGGRELEYNDVAAFAKTWQIVS